MSVVKVLYSDYDNGEIFVGSKSVGHISHDDLGYAGMNAVIDILSAVSKALGVVFVIDQEDEDE